MFLFSLNISLEGFTALQAAASVERTRHYVVLEHDIPQVCLTQLGDTERRGGCGTRNTNEKGLGRRLTENCVGFGAFRAMTMKNAVFWILGCANILKATA
jgi:hypothetical protein